MLGTWGTPGGGNRGSAMDVGDTRWWGQSEGTGWWGHRDAGDVRRLGHGSSRDAAGHRVVKTQGCQGQEAGRAWAGVGQQVAGSPRTPGMLSLEPQHIPPGTAAANGRRRPGR